MTAYYLSINKGQLDNQLGNVLVATSAPTADVYVQVDATTHTPDRKDVLLALKAIENYVLSNGVPGGKIGTDLPAN